MSDGSSNGLRQLRAVRAAGTIALDGTLDEPAWAVAPLARNFVQSEPREGEPATYDTEVRVLYDDDALYFGVFAKDEQPAGIIVSDLKKDFNTATSDGFLVILDTFHDRRNGYQFAINPAGAKWDAQMANEGRENNANWDGIWDVVTRIAETGWYAEIRIPFRTLRFSGGETEVWGVNFERKLRRLNEDSYWAPVPRIYDIQQVSLAGTLEQMRGVRPGKDLRVKPYASSSASTIADSDTDRRFRRRVRRQVRRHQRSHLGFHRQHRLLAGRGRRAADQPVALQSVFSGEARFLPRELGHLPVWRRLRRLRQPRCGGGGGGGTATGRTRPRRCGCSSAGASAYRRTDRSIPILAGTRLTGRAGRYSIGALNIQQRELQPVPASPRVACLPPTSRPCACGATSWRTRISVSCCSTRRRAARTTTGPLAWMRTSDSGFSTSTATWRRRFSPEPATAGGGRDYATTGRGQLSGPQVDSPHTIRQHRRALQTTRWVSCRARAWTIRSCLPRGAFRPRWMSQVDSRDPAALAVRHVYAAERRRPRIALPGFPLAAHLSRQLQHGSRDQHQPSRKSVQPFTVNTVRGVRVKPGRYEFNEYFIFWNTNSAARVSLNSRYSIGDVLRRIPPRLYAGAVRSA